MARRSQLRPPAAPAKPRVPSLLMRVWDAPTRLFHWAVVLLILTSYISIQKSWVQLHFLSGYTMLTLLLFRLAWGFAGSETSRFSRFLRSPVSGLQHLAAFGRREPDTDIGHNAAGGWMVLVMLLALGVQAITGLFSNHDIDAQGPLAYHLTKMRSDWFSTVHGLSFYVILVLVTLHVLAIVTYAMVKRHDLVRPMITGRKRLPATLQQPRFASPVLALLLLLGAAGLVWVLVRFA